MVLCMLRKGLGLSARESDKRIELSSFVLGTWAPATEKRPRTWEPSHCCHPPCPRQEGCLLIPHSRDPVLGPYEGGVKMSTWPLRCPGPPAALWEHHIHTSLWALVLPKSKKDQNQRSPCASVPTVL